MSILINIPCVVAPDAEIACCVHIVDMGSVAVEGVKSSNREILIGWELLGRQESLFDTPEIIYKTYGMRLTENSPLRIDADRILGSNKQKDWLRRFHPKSMLGRYCYIKVIDKENPGLLGARLEVFTLPDEQRVQALKKPVSIFSFFMASEPDMQLFDSLPGKIKRRIEKSAEFQCAIKNRGHHNDQE